MPEGMTVGLGIRLIQKDYGSHARPPAFEPSQGVGGQGRQAFGP